MENHASDWSLYALPAQLIGRATRLFTRVSEPRLRPLNFGLGQLPVLVALKDGALLSQKELARIAQIEQPSMAQMLARMERDGLIFRQPDPQDGRSSLIGLTELAKSRFPAGRDILGRGHREALRGFSVEEVHALSALLSRLVANLEAVDESSPAP